MREHSFVDFLVQFRVIKGLLGSFSSLDLLINLGVDES